MISLATSKVASPAVMHAYPCILVHRSCLRSGHVLESVGLPYCTLGSQRAGDGVSWVGIWRSWLLVQADCGQPWVQTWAHLFYRQKAGATPIPATLWGPGTAAPTRCLFLSTQFSHFEINLDVIWFKIVNVSYVKHKLGFLCLWTSDCTICLLYDCVTNN